MRNEAFKIFVLLYSKVVSKKLVEKNSLIDYSVYDRMVDNLMMSEGKDIIKELVRRENGQITIQVGAGIDVDTIQKIQPYTGAHAFHMSRKAVVESEMVYRKEGVSMGLPAFGEFESIRTEEEKIRKAKDLLHFL